MDDINIAQFIAPGHTKVAWFNGNPFPLTLDKLMNPVQLKNITFYLLNGFRLVWNEQWRIRGFEYLTDPQRPSDVTEMLKPGKTGSLLIRYGPHVLQDWSEGDLVNVVRVKIGERFITPSDEGEFSRFVYRQDIKVVHAPVSVDVRRQAAPRLAQGSGMTR